MREAPPGCPSGGASIGDRQVPTGAIALAAENTLSSTEHSGNHRHRATMSLGTATLTSEYEPRTHLTERAVMSLDPQWFTGDDFVMVHPDAVRHFHGDVLAVYVLARIRFRARAFGYERDGRTWWKSAAADLAADLGLSVDRVRRTLRTLVAHGSLIVAKHHERGSYDHTQSYALAYRESPGMTDVADSPHRSDTSAQSDVADSPIHDVADSPHLPIRSEELEEHRSPLAPLAVPVDIFEAFWQTYPRRIGEGAARRAWAKATRTTPAETILNGARAYAASRLPEARFIPSPATWLNDGRWTDDLTSVASSVPDVGPGPDRCHKPGHDAYSAHNCAGCRSDALIAGNAGA